MWPFKSKKSAPEPVETPQRLEKLELRLEKLEHDMRRFDEEWSEVYHKFRTLQLRVSKQVQRLDKVSSTEEPQRAGSDGNETPPGGPLFSSLSPRAQELQKQILARRARGQTGGE